MKLGQLWYFVLFGIEVYFRLEFAVAKIILSFF